MDIYITPKEVMETVERREAAERQMRVYGDSLKELTTILEPVTGSGSFLSRVVMDPPWPPAEPITGNPPFLPNVPVSGVESAAPRRSA
jgi:hypothetical protein